MTDHQNAGGESGFSLIETMVASLVLTIGLIGLAQLLAVATVMHSDARHATTDTVLAQAKMDELMKDPALQSSLSLYSIQIGSLASNMAPYYDEPEPGITRRWQVNDGPVDNTWVLQVTVENKGGRMYGGSQTLTTVVRRWW
jgi:Tfp pilus assembly protein PilV